MKNKVTNFIAGLGLAAQIASGQPLPDKTVEQPSLDQILKWSPENPGFWDITKTKVTEIIDMVSPASIVENIDTNSSETKISIKNWTSLETWLANNFLDNNWTSSNIKWFKTKSDTLFSVYWVSKEITGTSYSWVWLDIRGKQFEVKAEKWNNHTLLWGVWVLNVNEDVYIKWWAGLLNLGDVPLWTEWTKYDLKSTNIGAAVWYRWTISDSTHTNLELWRVANTVTWTFGKVTWNTDFIEAAVEMDFKNDMKARLAWSLERSTAKTNYGDNFSDTTAGVSTTLYPTKDLAFEIWYTGLDLHSWDYNVKAWVSFPFSEKWFESARPFVKADKNIWTHTTAWITYQSDIAKVDMSLKHTFERNVLATNINPTMSKWVDSQAKKYEEEQRLRNTTPHAVNDTTSTAYNTAKTWIDVLANDTYTNWIAPTLTGVITNKVGGDFVVNNWKIDFTPTNNFSWAASCTYEIQGTNWVKTTATLTVNVWSDNIAPNAPTWLSLNSWATYTNSTTVNLDWLTWPGDAAYWFVSESSSAPLTWDAGWVSSKPTSYTMSSWDGTKTIYVYVKDAAWNVQSVWVSDTIILDTVAVANNSVNFTQVNEWAWINQNETIPSWEAIKIVSWATIGWAVIPTTWIYETSPVVAITWTAGLWGTYSWTITVEDQAWNQKIITINLVVSTPI